jgi:two-component system chemotaxis sensor kinase CheA
VSHGIEPPDERIARGKPAEGTISLSAATVGEVVTIAVADDGRGIDAAAVLARARAVGLPEPADVSDPQALLALLCAPGFSTTADANRASGRGVGMAVVKSTVEELSGTLRVESTPGVGTRFLIDLPLTLSITDALIARIGGESFAVPQGAVREVIEVAAADVRALEQNEVVPYRGGALPIIRLSRMLGAAEEPADRFHAFVIGTGTAAVALAVPRITGHREIVVRAITDPLVKVDGVSGATDLGDGRVVLILEPAAIVRLTRRRAAASAAARGRIPA